MNSGMCNQQSSSGEEGSGLLQRLFLKRQKGMMFDIAILVILSIILYRSLLLPGIHLAGDWPYFSFEFIQDYLSWPSAWPFNGYLTRYEGIYSLYRYPVWSVQALIMELFPDQNIAMMFTYFIPLIILPPTGMYHLANKLYNNRTISFFAGLALTFNNVLPWRVALGQPTLAMVMALMPITLSFYIGCLLSSSTKAALLTASTLSISILYDLRTTYLTLLLIGTYGVYYIVINARARTLRSGIKNVIKSMIIISVVVSITQAYQIFPVVMMGLNTTPLPIGYVVPRALQSLSRLSSFYQILILSHFGWSLEEGPVIIQTVIALIAIGSLLRGRDSRIIYLVLVLITFAFLAKGSAGPLGSINDWLFINAPFFNWFREPLVFQMPQTVPFALLFGISAFKVCMFFQAFLKNYKMPTFHISALLLIILIFWSTWPVFSMTGTYGDPNTSYLAINSIPIEYYRVSKWLKSQPSGRVLMLPQWPSLMYTCYAFQGVVLCQSSLPLWGDYLKGLVESNETNGISKFLSLFNIKYVVLSPPEDIYWRFHTRPYSYYYSILNHTHGLKLINTTTQGVKIFVNEFTLSPVRVVSKVGLIVGSMSDMMRVIEYTDLKEWAFQFADQTFTTDLNIYSAIIIGKNRGISDIVLYLLNEDYRIYLSSYASPWDTKETSKWVLGYPIPSSLAHEIINNPNGLVAIPSLVQTAIMSFIYPVLESTLYDLWIRIGTGPLGGSVTVAVGDKMVGKVTFTSNTSVGLQWVKVGSILLQEGLMQVQLLGNGQIFLDMMVVVPNHTFNELKTSLLGIMSKAFTIDEWNNTMAINTYFQGESTNVQWIRRNPSLYHIECSNNSQGYLVLSELYNPYWSFISGSYETNSIPAYGLINMFPIDLTYSKGYLEYVPQRFVDLGVYISILGSMLIITLFIMSPRIWRENERK